MNRLVAAFARFVLLFQEAMHGANRAVIVPFVEQRRINSRLWSDPGTVLREDGLAPFCVPPGSGHELVSVAERSLR
jgi:hypothetical protein